MNAPVSAGPAREATPYPEVTQPSGWQSAWPAPPAPALPADALSAAAPAVKKTGGEPAGMPRALAAASVLLAINLLLSVVAALGSLLISDELVRLSLGREPLDSDHATVMSLHISFLVRAWGNVAIALIYAFLIWQLQHGNRMAWKRLVWMSIFGMAGVAYLLFMPYPMWLHIGQLLQMFVLFAMFALAVHPESRAWCDRASR